jgi:hypothetical protein
MSGPGPLSPEALRAYYAGQASTDPMMSAPPPVSSSAAAPAPTPTQTSRASAAPYYGSSAVPLPGPSSSPAAAYYGERPPAGPPQASAPEAAKDGGLDTALSYSLRPLMPLIGPLGATGPGASAIGASAQLLGPAIVMGKPADTGPPLDAHGNPVSVSEFQVGAQMSGPSPDEKPVALPFSKGLRPGEVGSRVFPTASVGAATQTGGAGGGGGGGAGSSDPYGVGKSRNALRQVAADEVGTTRKLGATEAAGALAVSEERTRLAREHSEDAAIEMETARFHRETIERHLNEASDQLDAVRSKKVDPLAYEKENGGHVMTVIGGLIGGLYQGLNKLDRNPFLDRFDRKVSESIALQERELSRKEKGVQDKVNLIGQLRNVYHDEELARQQARRMYYEAGLQAIEAKKGEYDAPAIIERAELGAEGLRGKMATQELAWGERAAAAAASAAAARRAEMWREREFRLKEEGAITDRIKAQADAKKHSNENLTTISKALSDPKYLEAKATLSELLPKVLDKDGNITKAVPGVGRLADVRSSWWMNPVVGAKDNPIWGLDAEERQGRMTMDRVFNSYKVAVTGSSGAEKEMEDLKTSFWGAKTPEEQAFAIRKANEVLQRHEQAVGALDPQAYKQFQQNQREIAGQQKADAPVKRESPQ